MEARVLLALGALLIAAPPARSAERPLDLRVLQHQALRGLESEGGRPTSFEAFGRRFDLVLERNERLGFVTPRTLPGVEALRGELRGLPRSWVRVTRTPAGLYGMFSDGRDVYVIEPAHELAGHAVGPLAARGREPVVYRLADTVMPVGGATCGTAATRPSFSVTTGQQQFEAVAAELQATVGAATLPGLQLELAIVGDYEFSRLSFGGGLTPEQAIAARMNVVDGIYSSQVGVKLVFDAVTVFRDPADPFSDTLTPGTLLDEFGNWRQATPSQRDAGLSHLMTGRDLDGTTVGIAYLNALCRSRFGVGLSQAAGLSTATHTLVIAHEIGHNFGAVHDGEGGSACESTPQTFLMAPRVTGSDRFSQCSLDTIAPSVAAAACVVPRAVADAALDLPEPAAQARGVAFDYGFGVRSSGEVAVDGVTVRITLPPALGFNSGGVSGGGACTSSGATVTCTVGSMAAGTSRGITLDLTGLATGSATAQFAMSASNDGVASNDSGAVTFGIVPVADLGVTLAASPASFSAGGSSRVTATVRHRAGDAVSDALLSIRTSGGLSVTEVAANSLGCSVSSGLVACRPAALAPAAVETVTLTVTSSVAGAASVEATVGSSVAEIGTDGDNRALLEVDVGAAAVGGGSGGGSGGGGGGGTTGLGALLALLAAVASRLLRARRS
jgi:hypothetical protein